MNSLNAVWSALKGTKARRMAVAAAADEQVLTAVSKACELGIAEAILVGDAAKIRQISGERGIDLSSFEIIDEPDNTAAARKAISLVSGGRADVIMKGFLDSPVFLKAVLDKKIGIRKEGSIISAIAVMDMPQQKRLVFITDPGFTPLPDLQTKKKLIENAVGVARKLGIDCPKVAALCAVETVSPKMIATIEAKELEEMNQRGEIKDCVVAGPISLDLALMESAAKHKGYDHPVGGKADILLVPTLEVGNVLYKALAFFANIPTGGIMTGANAPIVFTSRADTFETKLNTIALAMYLAQKG